MSQGLCLLSTEHSSFTGARDLCPRTLSVTHALSLNLTPTLTPTPAPNPTHTPSQPRILCFFDEDFITNAQSTHCLSYLIRNSCPPHSLPFGHIILQVLLSSSDKLIPRYLLTKSKIANLTSPSSAQPQLHSSLFAWLLKTSPLRLQRHSSTNWPVDTSIWLAHPWPRPQPLSLKRILTLTLSQPPYPQ